MAAPTYNESLNVMYATTWALRKPKIIDNIYTATPFFYAMKKRDRMDTQSGGRWIEHPLNYGKNESVGFIGRGGTVDLAHYDTVTTTHWDWKYLTGHIIRYFADFQKNRGKAALISKVNADIDNLQNSLIDATEDALFGDGTGDANKAFDGIGNIVAEAPATGTVGGLNRATYDWWRNKYKDMVDEDPSVYLSKRMRTMFNDCGAGGEGVSRFPDLIVCDQNSYELYDEECLEIGRILMGDKKMADLGFGDLAYKGRPMTWSPSCTDGSMYFLNTAFLKWTVDPVENFNLGEWLPIINQPRDVVSHAMAVGNLVCSNSKRQGVIFDIS